MSASPGASGMSCSPAAFRRAAAIQRLRDGGARVVCFAPALGIARKLVRAGADAIVIEGSEAGGHIGPVSTAVLAQEVLPHLSEVPVFVAGGIGRGEAMLSYLEMGAAGVQLGTRFVCAHELIAHPRFKRRSSARRRATRCRRSSSMRVFRSFRCARWRTRRPSGSATTQRAVIDRFNRGELSQKDAQLEIEHFWAGALRRAVIDGDVEGGSLMAGQSVGMVTREQSTADILGELVDQALAVIAARSRLRVPRPGTGRHRSGRGSLGVSEIVEERPAETRGRPAAPHPPAEPVSTTRRLLRRLRGIMAGSDAAQERLDRSSASSPPRWSPRSARPM